MMFKVEEVSDALLIAPWWPTAHWYPQHPILLPLWVSLLALPQEDILHPLKDLMCLAWRHVSTITSRSMEFLQGLPAMCLSRDIKEQKNSVQRHRNVSVAGVIGNTEILFKKI